MPMTEGEYPFVIHSYLVDDMFSYECVDDTIERRRIHLFRIDKRSL